MSTGKPKPGQQQRETIEKLYVELAGNISAIAREMGLARSTVYDHIRKMGGTTKPIAGGKVEGLATKKALKPAKGLVKRYLITSAQNNTHVNQSMWSNLLAMAEHYQAEVLVGTFSYNTNAYGKLAVKAGKMIPKQEQLWFDPLISGYINDKRIELANGLVWCGEMNISPTAEDPLSGLDTYTGRKSSIFPHSKLAMRSVATMRSEGTKLMYTTGTCTLKNYIQKKAGLKAEHHHSYSALMVEVNGDGNWWVRQVSATPEGLMQDLDVIADKGGITMNNRVEAITFGDIHATVADPIVTQASLDMLDELKPSYQFMHDILEGVVTNHHEWKNPHVQFKNYVRGLNRFAIEIGLTIEHLKKFVRLGCQTVIVDSNHDNPWIERWLRECDYRKDPANAVLFLDMQLAYYKSISAGRTFNPLAWVFSQVARKGFNYNFLKCDESFTICNKRIECGMHGHLGPNGTRGNPRSLRKVGRRANTAHTHSAGIWDGLYVAGTSTVLDWQYAKGPSSWTNTHIITYKNGMRTLVTLWKGQWRA